MPLPTTFRYAWFLVLGALVTGIAGIVAAVRENPGAGLRAFLAAVLGWAIIGLALTLSSFATRGFFLGGFFVAAGILSWTFSERPVVVWSLLAVEGVVFGAWVLAEYREQGRKLVFSDVRALPTLGAAWLGLAYWGLGTLGAVLAGAWKVGAQRLAYGGLFILAALAVLVVIRRTRQDPTPAIAAAFLLALGALLIAGSGNAFSSLHVVPDTAWGRNMEYRFWGGPGFLYHPNSIALIAVLVSLRIAPDRTFAAWQRCGVLAASSLMLLLVTSRTAWGFALVAAVVHAWLVWRERGVWRRSLLTALLPFVLLGVVAVGSGGYQWLVLNRYPGVSGGDVTSGRLETWKQVVRDFRGDSLGEQLFGNADNARGTVCRPNAVETTDGVARAALCGSDAPQVGGVTLPKLTTDNAFFGALRRGGVFGVLGFFVGLVLLVRRALSRDAAQWFAITGIAALVTIPTADWLLGGTGGTLWILLVAAEAWQVYGTKIRASAGKSTGLSRTPR